MTRALRFTGFATALLVGTALSSAAALAGQAGALDTTFGTGTDDGTPAGVVGTWLGKGDDVANAIVSQPDGKVVVVGNHGNGKDNDIFIARYTVDGALDESFGSGADGVPKGIVAIPMPGSNEFATTVALQADGHIVVGGYRQKDGNTDMIALRVAADGTLDKGFGRPKNGAPEGMLTIALAGGNEDVRAIAITADSKIVLAGNAVGKDGGTNMVVVRLNPDGTPDTSFAPGSNGGADGFNAVALGTGDDVVNDMALTSDGKIVLAGTHGLKGKPNVTVLRLEPTGALDQSFGVDDSDGTPPGVVSLTFGGSNEVARGVAVDPQGRIVVAAESVGQDGTTDIVVARLKPDGLADQEFAVAENGLPAGAARASASNGNDNATDVVLDSQGHIIVAGYHQEGGESRVSILRFTDDGKLDESFGAAEDKTRKGVASVAIGEGSALANGITVQGDKLILVGSGNTQKNGNSNIALMRLLAN